ncbi:MAG: NAD-binding protein, partial [Lachnospiraceae bacterium]|nr:NAD-binding protein [Lachnospiraceae bacterium]
MQILVVGVGNVGMSLVGQLSKEQHNITVVDTNSDNVEFAVNNFDVMGLVGNGASYQMM